MSPLRPHGAAAFLACLALLGPGRAFAQDPDSAVTAVPVDSVIITPGVPLATLAVDGDTTPRQPLTPRGAFIRSMVVPGWGQSAFGSYFRGGVFFAGWAGNWFMIFRNQVRLDNAENRYDLRAAQLREGLIANAPNPDSVIDLLENTDLLERTIRADTAAGAGNYLRKLVRAREQQREDWIAWTVFWILASGVDGYVTAHLADFPATIDIDPERDAGVTLRLEVPLGRQRP